MALMKLARHRRGAKAGGLRALLAGAALVLGVVALAGCGSSATAETRPDATESTSSASTGGSTGGGGKLDFSGKTLDGTDVSLGGYRGKPLVLAFMASW
ncbi:MAG: hypothetical protein JW990_10070 [Thermoleophilia bacterium]|nr:hypothetical protein [Thermoleophilia bacterium]